MGQLVAFLLAGLVLHVADGNLCESGSAACQEDRMTDAILSLAQFPSEHFLNAHCRIFNETVGCLVQEAKECDNSLHKDMVAEYEAVKTVVDNICKAGSPFRSSYLRSINCYNRHLDDFRNCTSSIKEQVDEFMASGVDAAQPLDLKSPFKYECLKMFMVPNCQIRETAQKCGMEAASPMRDILYGISNLMIKTLCDEEQSMAIWLDEFREYMTKKMQPTAAPGEEICITQSPEDKGQPTDRYEVTLPTGIPGTPAPSIRDVVLGIIRGSKGKMPKGSNNVKRASN